MNIYIHSQLAFLPCCAIYACCTGNAGSDKLIILAYARAIGSGFAWSKIGEFSTSLRRRYKSHILRLTDVVKGTLSWGLTKKGCLWREKEGMIVADQEKSV